MENRCQAKVHSGSQYDRLFGRDCRKAAKWEISFATGNTAKFCNPHKRQAEKAYDHIPNGIVEIKEL